MRLRSTASLAALAVASLPAASLAQAAPPIAAQQAPAGQPAPDAAPAADPPATDSEIVVTARSTFGEVPNAPPPVVELNEADIAAYGATSIEDLLAQLAPQVSSGRGRGDGGRPVFLVNGQRISSFREFGRYPPEAIQKVEILPEEVALRFGYPADQRVINFILKDNFVSREVELEYGQPGEGGYSSKEVEATLLRITGPRRLNLDLQVSDASPLTEFERGVIQPTNRIPGVATDSDPARFRTLRADTANYALNGTYTLGVGDAGGNLSLNGNLARSESRGLSGLDTVFLGPADTGVLRVLDDDALTRRVRTTTAQVGSTFNYPIGDYQFAATLDAGRVTTRTLIDQQRDTSGLAAAALAAGFDIAGPLPSVAAAGIDRALTKADSANLKTTLIGRPLLLPGGEITSTLDLGFNYNRIDSTDTRSLPTDLRRGNLNGGANLSIPITSRREDFGAAIGDLTLNLSGGIDRLSDFGTLADWSTGLTWRPTERLAVAATYIYAEAAPGLSQLGDPTVVTFNVPVFDFTRGESVLASITTGGNPNLRREEQRDLKLSANYDLDLFDRANLLVEYFRNESTNVTASFPVLTPSIEAAFPGRITRAANGTLLAIDRRAVTFAQTNSSRLRYGINVFGRVGRASPDGGGGGFGGGRGGGTGQPASADTQPGTGSNAGSNTGAASGAARFDYTQFAQFRQRFCATEPGQEASVLPDMSVMPQQLRDRVLDANGNPDPAKLAALRERFCAADGAAGAGNGPGAGAGMFDPQRFEALRTALCLEGDAVPDIATLPEGIAQRLRREDGTVDTERLAALRTRICAVPAAEGQPSGRQADGQATSGQGSQGQGSQGQGTQGQGGQRGGGRQGGGAASFGRGDGQGRWNLGLFHQIEFTNRVLVAPGGPLLDLLDGDALSGGGVPRHIVTLEGGAFYKGLGARLSGNYRSNTFVRGSGLPGSTDLNFGDIATFDLRLFVNLQEQGWLTGAGEPGFLKGARMSLRVDNLLNARQRITDATGTVPLAYQPALINPIGRYFEIEFRKIF